MKRTAVLFDLGGVVLGSPLQAIRSYETALGYAPDSINRVASKQFIPKAWLPNDLANSGFSLEMSKAFLARLDVIMSNACWLNWSSPSNNSSFF